MKKKEEKGVSVILCCYNSAKRLPKTLMCLAKQQVDLNINWEVVLINNNSSDNTVFVAEKLWKSFGVTIPLTIVEEEQAGLSFAREKGMATAKFDVFLFCDDDNWLDKNYIQIVYAKFKSNSNLGALGGWCDAVFEDSEPEWFTAFSGNFAVGKPQQNTGVLKTPNAYIYGAAMAISRFAKTQLNASGFVNILTDRKGKQLSSGGDVEIIHALRLLGFPVLFDDSLHFYHFMPKQRMTWEYLLRLRKSMYWSNFVLGMYIDTHKNIPFGLKALFKKAIANLKNIRAQKKKLIDKNAIDVLFIKNQIAVRKLFLKNILFYYNTRKRIHKIKNE